MEQVFDIAIITPTYRPHFKYVKQYLKSFDRYVADKESVPLYFIISQNESAEFDRIILPYRQRCDIHVLAFEDILLHYGITDMPNELLRKYGRYSFQTLKKYYAMMYIGKTYYLVLDSESCWVSETRMKTVFHRFFEAPFIPYSQRKINYAPASLREQVTAEAEYVLNAKTDRWYIECFSWFYEKRILEDMFSRYGDPIELVEKGLAYEREKGIGAGIFEILLYCIFLEANNVLYGYRFIDIVGEYRTCLSKEQFERYELARSKGQGPESGFAERFMLYLSQQNVTPAAKMYADNGFCILFCKTTGLANYYLQKKFIELSGTVILAAGQEHGFTPGHMFKVPLLTVKYALFSVWEWMKRGTRRVSPQTFEKMRTLRDRLLHR